MSDEIVELLNQKLAELERTIAHNQRQRERVLTALHAILPEAADGQRPNQPRGEAASGGGGDKPTQLDKAVEIVLGSHVALHVDAIARRLSEHGYGEDWKVIRESIRRNLSRRAEKKGDIVKTAPNTFARPAGSQLSLS